MVKFMFLGVSGSLQEPGGGNTSLLFFGEKGRAAVDLSCHIAAVVRADVDVVVFTHEHIDHVYGLPSLLHQLWISGRERELRIYAPEGMKELLERLIGVFKLREKKGMFPIRILSQTEFWVGSMKIALFRTDHTAVSVGLAVTEGMEKVIYTADTRPIRKPDPLMEGADILICEASGCFEEEEELIKKGHSSGRDAAWLGARLGVKRLYLCHLPEKGKEAVLAEAAAVFRETSVPELLKELP